MAARREIGSATAENSSPHQKINPKDIYRKIKAIPKRAIVNAYYPGLMDRIGKNMFSWHGVDTSLTTRNAIENPDREQDNIDLLRPYLEEGRKLIILLNHQGLGDGALTAPVANLIVQRYPELLSEIGYVYSTTIEGGKQGEDTKINYSGGEIFLRHNHMTPVKIVSNNDQTRRHETTVKFTGFKRILETLRKPKAGIAIHFEATMDPGRNNSDKTGINGMKHADKDVKDLMNGFVKDGGIPGPKVNGIRTFEKAVVLLIGIDGSPNIWDPNPISDDPDEVVMKGLSSWKVRKNIAKAEIAAFSQIPELMSRVYSRPYGSVVVDKPFPLEELLAFEDPMTEIEYRTSLLVPEYARGINKEEARRRELAKT